MTLLAVLVAVGTLVLLIAVVKLHPFVAFLIAAIAAAPIRTRRPMTAAGTVRSRTS